MRTRAAGLGGATASLVAAVAVAGCGGGGTDSSPANTVTAPAAPTTQATAPSTTTTGSSGGGDIASRAKQFAGCAQTAGLKTKDYGELLGAKEVIGFPGGKGFEKFTVRWYESPGAAQSAKAQELDVTKGVTPAVHIEQKADVLLVYDDSTPKDAVAKARGCIQ